MRRFLPALVFVLTLTTASWVTVQIASSHCEIPCGIYGDKIRIALFYEDISTVEKSMQSIEDPKTSLHQKVRWISNKEDHANKIQHTVTQYFMTQRVKAKDSSDPAYAKYVQQVTTLHQMLTHAMKSKQTTDSKHCTELRRLVDQFAASYFSEEDLKHIREHHGGGGK